MNPDQPALPPKTVPAHRRPILAQRIGELRRAYTSETDTTLFFAADAIHAALDLTQRTDVTRVLDGDYGARLLGDPGPAVAPTIRSAVLLDTTTTPQQELETALLLALGRVHTHYRHNPAMTPRAVCRMVRPTSEEMILHLSPQTLAVVLAELLPREHDGRLVGLAGLRWRLLRRHVELFLADAGPAVHVSIASTSHRQLTAAMAFATSITGLTVSPNDEPAPVSELEELAIAFGRVPGPVPVASALLRRFGLFHRADWLSIYPAGSSCLRFDWGGGVSPAQVAARLAHPIAGLPTDQFATVTQLDGTVVMRCEDLGATVALRQHDVAHPRRITEAWTAGHHASTAPISTSTAVHDGQPSRTPHCS